MRVPEVVLARLRVPLLAMAVAGCSTPAAETNAVVAPVSEQLASGVIDPVAYDVGAETERLERADRALAAAETRRTSRIEAEEEEARLARQRALSAMIGHRRPGFDWQMAACGRG